MYARISSGVRGLVPWCGLWLGLAGCGPSPVPDPAAFDDAPATRIVTLAPHLTELAYAAGAGPLLVGTVAFSDFPPAAARLRRVGDAFRLDYEALADLRPDLILAWQSGNPAAVRTRLRELGYRVVEVEPQRLDDIAEHLLLIGELAGTTATARPVAMQFRQRLAAIRARYLAAEPVRAFFQISAQPLVTVSGRHVIGQAIELCGGDNVFATAADPVPAIGIEAVLEARPQAILASRYDDRTTDAVLASWTAWRQVPAVVHGNLFLVDADLLSRPGTRILDGVERLCETLDIARGRLTSDDAQSSREPRS